MLNYTPGVMSLIDQQEEVFVERLIERLNVLLEADLGNEHFLVAHESLRLNEEARWKFRVYTNTDDQTCYWGETDRQVPALDWEITLWKHLRELRFSVIGLSRKIGEVPK